MSVSPCLVLVYRITTLLPLFLLFRGAGVYTVAMTGGNNLRVLIVAEDFLARAGLGTLLSGQPGCQVVGQVASAEGAPSALEVYRPDVLVWDLGWDADQALEHLAELSEGSPPVAALLPEETHTAEAWAAGARGLFLRDTPVSELSGGLQAIARGLVALDSRLASALLRPRGGTTPAPLEELTARELEVLRLIAEGLSNKAIALRLEISEHTVKFHVNAILSKLGAQSRTEAVTRATRLGLILL